MSSSTTTLQKTDIDWPGFLSQHDLHFDELPTGWKDAPHFGNAMLGSMLYVKDERFVLEVFRADVCDHRDETHGWTAYSRPHFCIGYFTLETAGAPTACSLRLDLWNAELSGTLTTDKGTLSIRHFVHAEDMAIVTELTASGDERLPEWTWHPYPAATTRPGYPKDEATLKQFAQKYGSHYKETLKPLTPNPEGRLETRGNTQVWVQNLLAGGQYATAWAGRVEDGTQRTVISIANTYPDASAAADQAADAVVASPWLGEQSNDFVASFVGNFVDTAKRAALPTDAAEPQRNDKVHDKVHDKGPDSMTEWVEIHRQWWHAYYPLSYLELPAKDLESLYWQTIYRYACCSRAGRYYIDTAGIWYQPSPWPYSTHDWNTQSAHWGVYAANRLDQGLEVVNRLHAAQDTLAANVLPEEWQENSALLKSEHQLPQKGFILLGAGKGNVPAGAAFLHLATAADMRGSRRSDKRYYDCLGCLPWLLHNAWWQYRFSMDDAMLRETIYPLLKRSMNLYFHTMWEDDDGRLHLQPTYSPETGVVDDANFDLALCKWGCHILLKTCKQLGIEDPLIPRWKEAIEKLIDFPVDERGFMLGSKVTRPHNHRHLSHLMMIYPLFLKNIDQPDAAKLLHTSYVEAHDPTGGVSGEPPNNVAMVQTHAGPMAAAIGNGDGALAGLRRIQAELERNGLWGCGGNPCIESTLGLATIIQDMLLQSWSDPALDEPGPIRVFPALPSEWQSETIEFHDLRAEGAFLVSARREGGYTQWIRIKSLAGEPCRIKTDMAAPVCKMNGSDATVTQDAAGLLTLHLDKGDEAVLRTEGNEEY
ncbi:MAG: hypothetical protein RRC34_02390 [Lentisphaeria bacterium]|nr:hypothetical protein [Lentisphaeria bacterium]